IAGPDELELFGLEGRDHAAEHELIVVRQHTVGFDDGGAAHRPDRGRAPIVDLGPAPDPVPARIEMKAITLAAPLDASSSAPTHRHHTHGRASGMGGRWED